MGKPTDEGHYAHANGRDNHGQPGIDGIGGGENAGNISAQAEKGRMAEGDLPGITEQEIQADGKHGVDADKDQHIQEIASLEQQGSAEKDAAKTKNFASSCFKIKPLSKFPLPCSGRGRKGVFTPVRFRLFEQSLGPEKEYQQQNDKGDGVFVTGGYQPCTQ